MNPQTQHTVDSARDLVAENGGDAVLPVHLLYCLLADDSLASTLLDDPKTTTSLIAKLMDVIISQPSSGEDLPKDEIALSDETQQILDKSGSSNLDLLAALIQTPETQAYIQQAGLDHQKLLQAIEQAR